MVGRRQGSGALAQVPAPDHSTIAAKGVPSPANSASRAAAATTGATVLLLAPHAQERSRVWICGMPFDRIGADGALDWLRRARADAPFRYVVTPNVDHLVRLAEDPTNLAPLYEGAELSLLDSRVLHRLLRFHDQRPMEVVPGSSLTEALFRRVIRHTDPIAVIGCPPAVIKALRRRYGLRKVWHHNPPIGFDRDPAAMAACVEFVRLHPARFVFLAVGSPRQERLADSIRRDGGIKGIGLCVGASLHFLAGAERRAPGWMQQLGLEWAHRLASDPARLWRRYLVDGPRILPLVLRDYRDRMRMRRKGERVVPRTA